MLNAQELLVRLGLLEDRQRLRSLMNRYQRCADAWDYAGTTNCFTEDGILEAPGLIVRGRAEMLRVLPALTAKTKNKFHMIANMAFDVRGDAATGHCAMHFVSTFSADRPSLLDDRGKPTGGSNGGGYYDATFVRADGGWLIARLVDGLTWYGSPAMPNSLAAPR